MSEDNNTLTDFRRDHYYFIHTVYSRMVRSLADFLRNEWFERTNEVVIGTYEQAIQHFKNRKEEAGEKFHPKYPFITINPDLNINPDETMGRFLYGYPNLGAGFGSSIYEPIYEDDSVTISPVLNRYKGNFEIILWTSSVYETIDYSFLISQYFGGTGMNRIIYPVIVEAFYILPDEFLMYTKENPISGETYEINWNNSNVKEMLVKTVNQERTVFPFNLRPWLRLNGVSDGSDKYGGSTDEISEYRLVLDVEWECSLPVYFVFKFNATAPACKSIQLDLRVTSDYVKAPLSEEEGQSLLIPNEKIIVYGEDEGEGSEGIVGEMHVVIDEKFIYTITEDDKNKIDNYENIEINVEQDLFDCTLVSLFGKYGELDRNLHYRLEDGKIILHGAFMDKLDIGNVIYIIKYKEYE